MSSVEDQVLRALRQEVLELRLEPGERLLLEDIAQRYQVSHTPVRQAIRRLVSEGLAVSLPRRGAHVAPLHVDELEEIQAIRDGVEPRLARIGCERCGPDQIAQMTELLEQIDVALAARDVDAYVHAQRRLRNVCYAAADRPRLERVLQEQQARAQRYVRFLIQDVALLEASREHQRQLLEACRAQDCDAAERGTHEAIAWTLAQLTRLLNDHLALSEETA